MKIFSRKSSKTGFTLVELLVAMAITTIIIMVLVAVTSVAIDAWKRSRAEVRASSQGKAMIDSMARDLEAMVVRSGNSYEWLHAETPATMPGEGQPDQIKVASSNALHLVFFTSATDRYAGLASSGSLKKGVGSDDDLGGDVSSVGYKLVYEDPLSRTGNSDYGTFALHRITVDPDKTFTDLLAQTDLHAAFQPYETNATAAESFICENVYQFTVTFLVEISRTTGSGSAATTTKSVVPVTMGKNFVTDFKVTGTNIAVSGSVSGATPDEIAAGRLVGAQIFLTVITDFGLEQLRARAFVNDADRVRFFAKNSFQYSKMIRLPGT
jgi:prepilin-type N-terminal cleavage/methylation domain-containing protein